MSRPQMAFSDRPEHEPLNPSETPEKGDGLAKTVNFPCSQLATIPMPPDLYPRASGHIATNRKFDKSAACD
jgi:hypothetical protein